MQKLECTIGTQGLSDGRRFHCGDVYEVDDETASTLVAAGYAKPIVEQIVETPVVVEPEVVDDEPVAPVPINKSSKTITKTKKKTGKR